MNIIWPRSYFIALLCSFILTTIFSAILIRLLTRLKIFDIPNERKIHITPIPRMGGIAIFAGFVIPMIGLNYFSHIEKGLMIGAGITLVIGALDDLFQISAVVKLICLFLLTLLLSQYDLLVQLPFPFWANLLMTMIWLVGITSAFNALDHMDGLASGIAIIGALMFLLVSLQTKQFFWGLASISLIGSLLGYMIFNWHPAKIFMGDSGSFFLGFTLAAIGIMGDWSQNPVKAAIVPIAILSLPIFDLFYVVITRRLNGTTKSFIEAVKYCDKDHIGHRLNAQGFSIPASVKIVRLISACIAFAALVLRNVGTLEAVFILFQIILIYNTIIVIFMGHRGKINSKNGK